MSRSRGMIRHGFNFYLVVSFVFHVAIMVCISAVSFPAPHQEEEEMVPVKIETKQAVQPRATAGGRGDFITPDADIVETTSSASLRRNTRLPASFRRAPRPTVTRKKPGVGAINRQTPGRQLVGSFQPNFNGFPSKIEFGKNIAETGESETEATERGSQRELEITTRDSKDQFMDLPRERDAEAAEPRIRSRSPFPYSELKAELPQNRVKIVLELRLDNSGQVVEVTVAEGSGREKVDQGIKNWVKNWRYQRLNSTTVTEVTVEIPGR